MIDNFSNFILRYRVFFVSIIFLFTIFMAYQSQFVRYNYNFAQTVPDSDEDMIYYKEFKKIFGEDGNVFAIGLKDSLIFDIKIFNKYLVYICSQYRIDLLKDFIRNKKYFFTNYSLLF